MSGYSLNEAYTRLTVWHFDTDSSLVSTIKYRYDRPKDQPRLSRDARYKMFAEFLRHNNVTPPQMTKGKEPK